MNKLPLFTLLLLASAAFGADAPRKIAFERGDNTVWVANLDGTGAKKIAAGVDPCISPDGAKLAFNTESASGPARSIVVIDLASGKRTVFKDVPSDNSFGPLWAPNSAKVLFYILIDGNWDIGLANADGAGFRVLKKAGPNNQGFFSACWMPDGQSLYCQDLQNLYHIDLDGGVIKQWPLQKIFLDGDMDSNVRLDISADGRTMLAEVNDGDSTAAPKGWDGPSPEVWSLDLATNKAAQVTPAFSWEPCWAGADQFLCISQGPKEKQPSIYLRSLDGKTSKLVVKNATDPSVSK